MLSTSARYCGQSQISKYPDIQISKYLNMQISMGGVHFTCFRPEIPIFEHIWSKNPKLFAQSEI